MPRIKQLTKLFRAIASNDLPIAGEIAAQIAAEEEKKGHRTAAQLLRGSLHPNSKGESRGVASTNGHYENAKILSNALTVVNDAMCMEDVMLRRDSRSELAEVVREWKFSQQLAALKIRRRSRLFFYGPPGCGKSLSAQALGREMSLPTYVVRFDAVIGAYLGQTALHLRELFRFAEQTPCVLVFDEVRQIALQRIERDSCRKKKSRYSVQSLHSPLISLAAAPIPRRTVRAVAHRIPEVIDTCGAFIEDLTAEGLVTEPGAPSPFTRIGPGIADSPKPDFSGPGGNLNENFRFAAGLGVWGCNAAGLWEDHSGTSFAAPILARVAAFTLHELQKVCEPGTKPFSVTAKAYMALTAIAPTPTHALKALAERTLGTGRATVKRLSSPSAESAIMVWQGTIDNPDDIARVQIPVPLKWLKDAKQPHLRLVVSWDTPVNAAVHEVWASRKVSAQLRVVPDKKAVAGSRTGHASYPWIDRLYNLSKLSPDNGVPAEDNWLLELSYVNIADYYPAIDFSPIQRVALAAELFDRDEKPVSPQEAVQALPIASTLQRLSVTAVPVRSMIAIKSRV